MTPAARRAFFSVLQRAAPRPSTELVYDNAYQLLVAVVLSAQATDKGVNAATAPLFRRVRAPAAMVRLREAGLIEYIKHIGLYRSKARHIIRLSELLLSRHQGKVPATRAELEALPGVGRKTANVVLNVVYGRPTIAVDTHIFRVSNRTGLAPGKTVLEVEEKLEAAVPVEFKPHAHHWLILLGRYTCKARRPLCGDCRVRSYCAYPNKTDAG